MLEEQLKKARNEVSLQRRSSAFKIAGAAAGTVMALAVLTYILQSTSIQNSEDSHLVADSVSSSQTHVGREEFKEAVKVFERDVEPHVSTDPFGKWNGDAQHQILSGKDKAISLFSSGDYAVALKELETATKVAISELDTMNKAFEEAMAQAQSLYSQDDYDKARVEISKAISIRPDDEDALMLEVQIDALPRVLELVKAAEVARSENNLKDEASTLQLILALAPNRKAAQARLVEVSKLIEEQDFAAFIRQGMMRVSQKKLAEARQNLRGAQGIFPDREEVALLRSEVANLSRMLKVESLLGKASKAVRNDDWATAEQLYADVMAIEPNNAAAVQGGTTAQGILSLQGKINAHLNNPHRLGSSAVVADVKTILGQSVNYHKQSPTLAASASLLEQQLKAYGTKVPVLIRSDNHTNILVRGVGKVGQTTERYIELKPGAYTFEGLRPGYKSRLMSVTVEPNSTDLVVEIVCNERL